MPEPTAAGHSPPLGLSDIDPNQRSAVHRYRTWRRFHDGPRSSGQLLRKLDRYPGAVLVAGCQRSGTTMVTRIIAGSAGFRKLSFTHDDELDAALALSGEIDLPERFRYCFQTTYLNDCFREYASIGPDQRLIWVLRNPYSVVHSMLHNWKRFALNELYQQCGADWAGQAGVQGARDRWPFGPSMLEKACLSYAAKTSQILEIQSMVPAKQLMVVEYDQVVRAPRQWLPAIFGFIGEPYVDDYASQVRVDSISKAGSLAAQVHARITQWCEPAYQRTLAAVSPLADS